MAITKFSYQQFKSNSIDLSTKVYGLLAISRISSGIGAGITTYLRGDNTWNTPVNYPLDYPSRERVAYEISAADEGGGIVGGEATTTAGTTTGTVTTIQNSLGTCNNHASATATSGLVQGIRCTTFNQMLLQSSPIFSTTVLFPTATDITNVRIWVGAFAGTPVGSDVPPVASMMAFRYSTSADGTVFWRTVTQDTTSATTVQITTTPIAINTKYYLKIDATNQASIKFYINNVLVTTHTTNLPGNNFVMGFTVASTNLTALVRNIRWYKIMMDFN